MDLVLRREVERLVAGGGADTASLCHDLLVDFLEAHGFISSPGVERAFRSLPRHLFVAAADLRDVYRDHAIVTRVGDDGRIDSSASAPSIIAAMIEGLDLQGGERVLELGTGTGWSAALTSAAAPDVTVTTYDIERDLVRAAETRFVDLGISSVEARWGDGALDPGDHDAFDRIVLTYAAREIRPEWLELLRPDGLIVVPVGQVVYSFRRDGRRLVGHPVILTDFLACRSGAPGDPWMAVGESGVRVWLADGPRTGLEWLAEDPSDTSLGPRMPLANLAAAQLVLAVTRPQSYVQVASDEDWGFGLVAVDGRSAALCRLGGSFAFRHYPLVAENPLFAQFGDPGATEHLFSTLDLLADAGWPTLTDLAVSVNAASGSPAPLQVTRGVHDWCYELAPV